MENDRCRASSMSHARCGNHRRGEILDLSSLSPLSLLSMNPPNEGLKYPPILLLRVCGRRAAASRVGSCVP